MKQSFINNTGSLNFQRNYSIPLVQGCIHKPCFHRTTRKAMDLPLRMFKCFCFGQSGLITLLTCLTDGHMHVIVLLLENIHTGIFNSAHTTQDIFDLGLRSINQFRERTVESVNSTKEHSLCILS